MPSYEQRQPYVASSLINTIPKLEGSRNFEAWYTQFSAICRLDQVWEVAAGMVAKPSEQQGMQLLEWRRANNHIVALIQLSLKSGPLTYVAGLEDAASMVAKLKEVYQSSSYSARDLVFRQATRSTLADYKSIAEYGESIKKSRIKLQDMGFPLPEWVFTTAFLHGLSDSHEDMVAWILNTRQRDADNKPVEPELDNVIEQFVDRERRQRTSDNDKGKALKADSSGYRNWGPSKSRQGNEERCGYCRSLKHKEADCWLKYPHKAPDGWREDNQDRINELKKKKRSTNKKDSGTANKAADGSTADPQKSLLVKTATANRAATRRDPRWYFDSAASIHMTYTDRHYKAAPTPASTNIILADGSSVTANGVGTIQLRVLINNESKVINISNVYHCPDLDSNLLSLGTLEAKGFGWAGNNGKLHVLDEDEVVLEGTREGTLYRLNLDQDYKTAMLGRTAKAADIKLWHRRLGHLNLTDIHRLGTMSEGMNIKNNNKQDHFCEACTLGKQHRTPSRQPMDRATTKFERIHTDIGGGGPTEFSSHCLSFGCNRHFWMLVIYHIQ